MNPDPPFTRTTPSTWRLAVDLLRRGRIVTPLAQLFALVLLWFLATDTGDGRGFSLAIFMLSAGVAPLGRDGSMTDASWRVMLGTPQSVIWRTHMAISLAVPTLASVVATGVLLSGVAPDHVPTMLASASALPVVLCAEAFVGFLHHHGKLPRRFAVAARPLVALVTLVTVLGAWPPLRHDLAYLGIVAAATAVSGVLAGRIVVDRSHADVIA